MNQFIRIFSVAAMVTNSTFAQCIQTDIPDPSPNCTPGVIASTDINEVCGLTNGLTYSQRHRKTTISMKQQIYREYNKEICGEIDHKLELSLGGADDVKNLWCQPGPKTSIWNYKLKDKLESLIWRRVCIDKTMNLNVAQDIFMNNDWRLEYCQLIGGPPCITTNTGTH